MPFPILRTPFVVLSEIISILEPNDIVTASFCSKNVERLLKSHYQQRKPLEWRFIMLDYDSEGLVDIKTSEEGKQITVLSAKDISVLNGNDMKYINGYLIGFACSQYPVLYFNDQVLGTKMIVDYVTRLFGLDVYGLHSDRNGTWAIDWINDRQEKMLDSFVWEKSSKYNDSNADETLDYVLRNTRVSLYCNIDDNVSDNFQYNGKLGPTRQLWIRSNGHWVTSDNLMKFDCLDIGIQGSRLSEKFDEDLEVVETDEERVFRRSFDGWKRVFYGGYRIHRADGTKAMIQCEPGRLLMGVWHERASQSLQ